MKKIFFLMPLLSLASLRAIEGNDIVSRIAQLNFINEPETNRAVSRFSADRDPASLFSMEEAPPVASSHRGVKDPTLSDDNQECMQVMFGYSRGFSQEETEEDDCENAKFRQHMQEDLESKLRALYDHCSSLLEANGEEGQTIMRTIKKKLNRFESEYYGNIEYLGNDKYDAAIKEIEAICRNYRAFDK